MEGSNMDFDPRDTDARDDERFLFDRHRAGRDNSRDNLSRDDDLKPPAGRSRDRDNDARELGRGPGDKSRQSNSDEHGRDPREDARWPERDREPRERGVDPREVFARDLNLPRGPEREIVHDTRERAYTLRGSETRTLSTVGAFRVVSARDLRSE